MNTDDFSGALEDAYLIGFLGGLVVFIWANVVLFKVWQSSFKNGVFLGFGATFLMVGAVSHHIHYVSEFKEFVADAEEES